ncbi:MAG TPA: 30S ribosomal protein S2 [Candidatus Dojkabacteria bacterium]|nr:30S ribosomal protein S2 [Candidatus Dojkabacteria bacterium]
MSETKTKMPEVTMPTLEELLQAGAHFGHKTSAWNPKMKKFIYTERNGVHIIDLVATLTQLKKAVEVIQEAASKGNVLLVGTKGQAASLVQQVAEEKGAFYINKRWPGGLFTNFKVIKKSIDNLVAMEEKLAMGNEDMVKKEELLMQREVERLNKIYSGIKFMDKVPALMVVIDTKLEKNAIREAKNAGIPIVALLDTNCDPLQVQFPIPANDDSIRSISLFLNVLGEAIGTGTKSAALITLRKEFTERLNKINTERIANEERVKAMEEAEKERIKALKEGKEVVVEANNTGMGVVRLIKQEPVAVVEEVKPVAKKAAPKAVKKTIAKKSVTKKPVAKKAPVKKAAKKVSKAKAK